MENTEAWQIHAVYWGEDQCLQSDSRADLRERIYLVTHFPIDSFSFHDTLRLKWNSGHQLAHLYFFSVIILRPFHVSVSWHCYYSLM